MASWSDRREGICRPTRTHGEGRVQAERRREVVLALELLNNRVKPLGEQLSTVYKGWAGNDPQP
jgi:hypothetical protein